MLFKAPLVFHTVTIQMGMEDDVEMVVKCYWDATCIATKILPRGLLREMSFECPKGRLEVNDR